MTSSRMFLTLRLGAREDRTDEPPKILTAPILAKDEEKLKTVQTRPKMTPSEDTLAIQFMRLNGIPKSVLSMHALVTLNLSNNEITEMHPDLFSLRLLKGLVLSHNKISSIPKDINKLIFLEILNLSANPVTTAAIEAAELDAVTSLQELYLIQTDLDSIPTSIFKLEKLTKLALSQNRILEIPVDIARLRNLTWLGLSNNFLSDLEPIYHLKNLKGITVDGNPLRDEMKENYKLRLHVSVARLPLPNLESNDDSRKRNSMYLSNARSIEFRKNRIGSPDKSISSNKYSSPKTMTPDRDLKSVTDDPGSRVSDSLDHSHRSTSSCLAEISLPPISPLSPLTSILNSRSCSNVSTKSNSPSALISIPIESKIELSNTTALTSSISVQSNGSGQNNTNFHPQSDITCSTDESTYAKDITSSSCNTQPKTLRGYPSITVSESEISQTTASKVCTYLQNHDGNSKTSVTSFKSLKESKLQIPLLRRRIHITLLRRSKSESSLGNCLPDEINFFSHSSLSLANEDAANGTKGTNKLNSGSVKKFSREYICAICKTKIPDQFISACDRVYHPGCFSCNESMCHKVLTSTYYIHKNRPYCADHTKFASGRK